MKQFEINKRFTEEDNNEVLTIYIKHCLNKNQSKNRLLLFNSESATYKYNKKKEKTLWQQKQN